MTFQKTSKTRLAITGLTLGLLMPLHSALAASSASASLDWSQFQIQTLFGSVDFGAPITPYTSIHASVYGNTSSNHNSLDSEINSSSDWISPLSADAIAPPFGSATGSADTNSLTTQALSNYYNYYSNGSVSRSAAFSMTGSGIIEITIPYTLTVQSDAINPGDEGFASSSVNLYSSFYSAGFNEQTSKHASLYDSYWEANSTRSGVLSLIFRVDGDASININASTSAYAYGSDNNAPPVPVPGAIWLMGSGLLGFLSMTRRKK